MTATGEKLPDVSPEEVTDLLATTRDGKAVKRLVVAREYLAGRSPAAIEARWGIPAQTCYEWLDRFEERGLEGALEDDTPPGRTPDLSEDERARFEVAVERPPIESGFDAPFWTAPLAREYIREEFGVEYSHRHVRRLLTETDAATESDRR
ncbi:helix-turn-helix domain containing protein [Halorarum halophilum]|uniref:Helix-turn-helix domain containing protein n=1 Tax=Halorarum halophilum TaxID=2743090 RepID=A0A7D5KND4_9EURY|nr:helix-turn-helix domain-containing protein [Halobaculum halophilum]QLG29215.1 helix-turn-helix domain containing protein [Halobaculum halophilum]